MHFQEPLEEADLCESNTFCELRVPELALQARGESLRRQSVRWVGDSQSGVTILMVGGMKPRCYAVAVRIWQFACKFDINLSCTWMLHTSHEIQVAGDLSKINYS